ncbi:MAG: hypothetical protein HYZ37_12840 [Candidatus Solibacter usitatus]|nr:hypothetical protein [Candidatus Solibacter usitatus]
MSHEERFERIERNLDALTNLSLHQAERQSERELAMEKLASAQRHLLTAKMLMSRRSRNLSVQCAYRHRDSAAKPATGKLNATS